MNKLSTPPPLPPLFSPSHHSKTEPSSHGFNTTTNENRTTTTTTTSFSSVRLLIIGLLALGSFTTNMSGSIMNSAILAMAPQRTAGGSSLSPPAKDHHHNQLNHHPPQIKFGSSSPLFSTKNNNNSSKSSADHLPMTTTTKTKVELQKTSTFDHFVSSPSPPPPPEFTWSEGRQNWLLVSYNIGYVAALLPAGALVEQYGGFHFALLGGLGHVLANALGPGAARTSYWALFALRILLGGLQALLVPSFYSLVSRWVPDEEKSKAVASAGVGGSLGNIGLNLLSGYVCEHFGWSVLFYLVALFNLLWAGLWWAMASNSPADHHLISKAEREYISKRTVSSLLDTSSSSSSSSFSTSSSNSDLSDLTADRITPPPPPPSIKTWLKMLTSKTVRGTIFVAICHTWFYGVLLQKLPAYMLSVLRMDLQEISYFNMVHQSVLLLSVLFNGVLSDWITTVSRRNRKLGAGRGCRKTTQRKAFESVATFGTALFTSLLPLATNGGGGRWSFLLVISLAVACVGSTTGGSDVIIFDLTTRHTSILIALISSVTTVSSLFVPSLVTLILDAEEGGGGGRKEGGFLPLADDKEGDRAETSSRTVLKTQWNVVFLVTAALHCTGGLVFALTASARRQKWNGEEGEEEEEEAN